jgi:hypothetical protein
MFTPPLGIVGVASSPDLDRVSCVVFELFLTPLF